MEAASIPWRPLGRLLVEQGLLTDEELELALAKQQVTGKRLGETIVECGFVSRPDLSNALAAQYGIELTAETGFGTGLRAQIQQRHESDRGRVVPMRIVAAPELVVEAGPEAAGAETESTSSAEALLLAQLEEQWAKLAAAEDKLAEREVAFVAVVEERDSRRAQAERLARRARRARAAEADRNEELRNLGMVVDVEVDEQRALVAAAEERLAERERELTRLAADVGRLNEDVRGCDAEIARLRQENMRRRAQGVRLAARLRELRRAPDAVPVVTHASHLAFVELTGGYSLVEREGPPPPRNAPLELPELCDETLVVAGLRPSPFPGDPRPCVVVQRT